MPKKYRLIKVPLNWAIEPWQEGGEIVKRGRYAGKPMKSRWDQVNRSYYPNLEAAARALLNKAIDDRLDGDLDMNKVLTAIAEAKKQVVEAVNNVVEIED
jgi:hypothetical protein